MRNADAQLLWDAFVSDKKISKTQLVAFKTYYELLMEWNKVMNLTAITELEAVLYDHFRDALAVIDTDLIKPGMTVCDVGSGCGVPGIPLALVRSDINVVLIEVNTKKISFLHTVIATLGLTHVTVCTLDWKTFVAKAPLRIDIFCARASLRPQVLVSVFNSVAYKKATLIYFASQLWQMHDQEKPFYAGDKRYTLKDKVRRLLFFKKPM